MNQKVQHFFRTQPYVLGRKDNATITSRKLYGKLSSFIGTMRDGMARKMVEGQQGLID